MNKSTKTILIITILIIIGSVLLVCGCLTTGIVATGLWSFVSVVNFVDRSVSESPQVAVRL